MARQGSPSFSPWILVALGVLAAYVGSSFWNGSSRVPVGSDLPAFRVEGWLNADQPPTREQLQGQVVLIDCWASWCLPCRAKMPQLVALARQYEPQGVVVIGLTPESDDQLPQVRNYMQSVSGLDWPTGYGANPVLSALNVTAFPTYIVFNRAGNVVWSGHDLYRAEDALVRALAR